jgi:signal peptidase II
MNGVGSQGVGAHAGNRPRADYLFLAVVSVAVLALDFATKALARRHLPGFLDSTNLGDHITLMLKENSGGAFGLMAGASQPLNRVVFSLVSLVSIIVVVWLYLRLSPERPLLKWGLPLVLGGAIGNLLDRLRFGHVLDFVDVHVLIRGIERHAAPFNLADVAITIGVGLLALDGVRARRRRDGAPAAPDSHRRPSGSTQPTP